MKNIILLFLLLPFLALTQQQIGQDINGETYNFLGASVSLSADGSIVAVGVPYMLNPYNDFNRETPGRVSIYQNNSEVWEQIGDDIIGLYPDDAFGYGLSLSSDGNTIAIGAPRSSEGPRYVRVYENNSGVWEQVGDDLNGNSFFGLSVSLSSDGSKVAVSQDSDFNNIGNVRIYQNNSGVWEQVGGDINVMGFEDNVRSVSLSSDGNIVAYGTTNGTTNKVRIYENNSGVWQQIGSDLNEQHSFGNSVSLSSDGSILAVGAPKGYFWDVEGKVYIYENISGEWQQIGAPIIGDSIGDLFGNSISLSSDGNIVAVGVPGGGVGKVCVYENNSGVWQQISTTINGVTYNSLFGNSVSLSSDGSILACGAPLNNTSVYSGLVRIYDLNEELTTTEFNISNFTLYPNPAKTQFTIQLNDTSILEQVIIYNTLGQEVLTSNDTIIDTSTLASGSYIVEITTNNGKASKKLIIE
jgi:hypothetical protein